MKILYISNYPLSGLQAPSINEIDFCECVNRKFKKDCFYFVAEGPVDIPVPSNQIEFFKDVSLTRPFKFIKESFKWAQRAKAIANKHKADIIVIRTNRAPLKEVLLKLFSKKTVILKTSARYWIDTPSVNFLDATLKKIDLFFYKVLHKLCDGIECVTDEYMQFHKKNGMVKTKLTAIGNAVSIRRFNISNQTLAPLPDSFKNFGPILGYCGTSPSERGAKEILHVMNALRDEYPHMAGIIIGDDDKLKQLQQQAKQLGLSDRFLCIGRIPFPKVATYLPHFDIGFSFSSQADLVGGDSALKVRQYLACGLPVITFPRSNQFIADNNLGYLVDLGDTDSLVKATRKCIEDFYKDNDAQKQVINKYANDNFSHESMLEKRIQFWNQIIAMSGN